MKKHRKRSKRWRPNRVLFLLRIHRWSDLAQKTFLQEVWFTDRHMTTREKLAEAVLAVAGLPKEAQEKIAEELLVRVSDFSQSQLNAAQRREIKRRLAQSRVRVPDADVRALFRRYNPAL